MPLCVIVYMHRPFTRHFGRGTRKNLETSVIIQHFDNSNSDRNTPSYIIIAPVTYFNSEHIMDFRTSIGTPTLIAERRVHVY